jgi:RNA polymerase sigma factor (sigma-70 family)
LLVYQIELPQEEPKDAPNSVDARCFEEFVRQHFSTIYCVVLGYVGSREAAEDIAQETCLRAYLKLQTLRDSDRLLAWTLRIARHLATDSLRSRKAANRLIQWVSLDEQDTELVPRRSVWEGIYQSEQSKLVREAVLALPRGQREVVLMHYAEQLSKSEVARRLGIHPTSVGRRLDDALLTLQMRLRVALQTDLRPFRSRPAVRRQTVTAAGLLLLALPASVRAQAVLAPTPLQLLHAAIQPFATFFHRALPGHTLSQAGKLMISGPIIPACAAFAAIALFATQQTIPADVQTSTLAAAADPEVATAPYAANFTDTPMSGPAATTIFAANPSGATTFSANLIVPGAFVANPPVPPAAPRPPVPPADPGTFAATPSAATTFGASPVATTRQTTPAHPPSQVLAADPAARTAQITRAAAELAEFAARDAAAEAAKVANAEAAKAVNAATAASNASASGSASPVVPGAEAAANTPAPYTESRPDAGPSATTIAPLKMAEVRTETRPLEAFHGIRVSGSAEVQVNIGKGPHQAQVTADATTLANLETEVRDGVLDIYTKSSSNSNFRKARIVVQTEQLDQAILSGSSANITLNDVQTDHLKASISGSGKIFAHGQAQSVTLQISGSGDVDLRKVSAEKATVDISGSGTALVHSTAALNVYISGSGTIRYEGNPAKINKQITGSGKLIPM